MVGLDLPEAYPVLDASLKYFCGLSGNKRPNFRLALARAKQHLTDRQISFPGTGPLDPTVAHTHRAGRAARNAGATAPKMRHA